jgi:hypothetical protein
MASASTITKIEYFRLGKSYQQHRKLNRIPSRVAVRQGTGCGGVSSLTRDMVASGYFENPPKRVQNDQLNASERDWYQMLSHVSHGLVGLEQKKKVAFVTWSLEVLFDSPCVAHTSW